MARGSQTLFADVFEDEPVTHRKGRSAELHAKRNECLVDRYYYYGKFEKWRYNIILETLSAQFFISTITIAEAIEGNFDQLSALKKEQPSIIYFKKKWDHLVW